MLGICFSLRQGSMPTACCSLVRDNAFRIEVRDVSALRSGRRVDDAVDQRRALGCERSRQGLGQAGLVLGVVANSAERLDHLVVAGVLDKAGWGWRKHASFVAVIDPAVIEDHRNNWKS